MNRINTKLFDRTKKLFASDRHELRRVASVYWYTQREFEDWKKELSLPIKYETNELDLYYIGIKSAIQHFESSMDFAMALEMLINQPNANNVPAICMMLRQTYECVLTSKWILEENNSREVAKKAYRLTMRDLNNLRHYSNDLDRYDINKHFVSSISIPEIDAKKLALFKIGTELEFNGKELKRKQEPLIGKLFRTAKVGSRELDLSWAYMMMSSIGHGTWMGFYPSDRELTILLELKNQITREVFNMLKLRTKILVG